MTDDLQENQLRAIQYFYVDGSFEFGFGLLCLILAVFFYAEMHIQVWLSGLVDSSLVLVMIGGAWLINRFIKQLKERITWPRTGYVTYSRQNKPRGRLGAILGMGIGGLAAAAVMTLVTNPNIQIAVLPLLSGLLLGLVLVILAWRARLLRFYFLAALSLAGGIALAFSRLGNSGSLPVYYLGMSLVLFGSGTCVLRRYLRRNPLAEESK